MTRRQFREGVDLCEEVDRLAARRPPFAFAAAYDPERGIDRHFIGPVELACADSDLLLVRTRPLLDSPSIEEVTSLSRVAPPPRRTER